MLVCRKSKVMGSNQSLCMKSDIRLPSIFSSSVPHQVGTQSGLALGPFLIEMDFKSFEEAEIDFVISVFSFSIFLSSYRYGMSS